MFNYMPEKNMICTICHGPSRFSCSYCDSTFFCHDGQCRQPLIGDICIYHNNWILHRFLYVMGSH